MTTPASSSSGLHWNRTREVAVHGICFAWPAGAEVRAKALFTFTPHYPGKVAIQPPVSAGKPLVNRDS